MRNVLIVILVMIQGASNAQFVKSEFRTVMEDGFMLHYLKFLRQGTAQVKFSINHGQAMAGLQAKTYELNYTVKGDTLRFTQIEQSDTINPIIKIILNGSFFIKSSDFIVDTKSGYPYISKKFAPVNTVTFVLNKKILKQKISKVDSYGLIKKEYRQNRKLRRELKDIDVNNYDGQVLRGLVAFKKYGIDGMNIVYEFEQKK